MRHCSPPALLSLGKARLATGTVPLQAYEDIRHLLFAQVCVWVTAFIASVAQRCGIVPRLKAWALLSLGSLHCSASCFLWVRRVVQSITFAVWASNSWTQLNRARERREKGLSTSPVSSMEWRGAGDTMLQQEPWQSLIVWGAASSAHWLAAWEELEGGRDKAWILVTRLIKDLFQP